MTEEKNMITVNGIEHNIADLKDNEKYFIAQVKDLNAKMGNLQFQLDQVTVAKESFTQALIKSIETEEVENEDGDKT